MHRKSFHLTLISVLVASLAAATIQAAEPVPVPGRAQCLAVSDLPEYGRCLAKQASERSDIVRAAEQRVLDVIGRWNKDEGERDRASRYFKSSKMSFSSLKASMCEGIAISAADKPRADDLRFGCQEQLDTEWLAHLARLATQFGP